MPERVGRRACGRCGGSAPRRRIGNADYNGQTAVDTCDVLSILGYDARGLQFGMRGWRKDDAPVSPFKRFPVD